MSWQQVKGNWRQFVGEVKQRWSKLADSDLMECEGKRDELVGKLQKLYGMSADEAGKEIAKIEARVKDAKAGAERMHGAA